MTLPFARLPGRLRLTAAALVGAYLVAPYSPSQESTDVAPIIPFPTATRTLPNGLNIIVVPMPSDGLVAYWSIVRTGSRDEYEAGRSGFAHFFEHMMFRGTERFPSDVYSRIITTIGADANAYTTDDHTAYHLSMAAEDLEQVMELESDRFQRLSYAEAAFQTEAGAVYGEYRKTRTDPEFALYEELVGTAFERHPYGHTTLGYERDIAIMPTLYEYSRTFFGRYYRPDNTVLFIAGDVTPANVFALVEKHYGSWQRGYVPPQIPVEPEQTAERRIDVGYDGQTLPLLQLAYKLPVFDPADRTRVAADLFADLAFGETSEAYRRLVLDEQVLEDLDAGAAYNRDPGLLEITARIKDPSKIDHVLGVIDSTIAHFRATAPDAQRLADLQRRLRYGFLMGLQTPDSLAVRVTPFIALSGDLHGLDRLYATYAAITPADVHAAAERYLHSERRTVGVLKSRQ
jgi:zinc protease